MQQRLILFSISGRVAEILLRQAQSLWAEVFVPDRGFFNQRLAFLKKGGSSKSKVIIPGTRWFECGTAKIINNFI